MPRSVLIKGKIVLARIIRKEILRVLMALVILSLLSVTVAAFELLITLFIHLLWLILMDAGGIPTTTNPIIIIVFI